MKTIIIPDIHNKVALADTILQTVGDYDRAIFLGDYFDDFNDTEFSVIATATWLKRILTDSRHECLIGNHDLSYMYPGSKAAYCPGWSPLKSSAVNRVLSEADWKKLKFYVEAHGILFSHAGISANLYSVVPDSLKDLKFTLDAELEYACRKLAFNEYSMILGIGYDRGGNRPVGGLIWCNHSNHIPFKNIPQIYGHTPLKVPDYRIRHNDFGTTFFCSPFDGRNILEKHHADKPWSLCLDTHLKHYAVIEDDSLHIYAVSTFAKIHTRKLF